MNFNKIHSVYFIGIGGIGMSALSRYFNSIGKLVYGYDRSKTVLSEKLQAEGISVSYIDEINTIPAQIANQTTETLIIYTPAIPENNAIFQYFKSQNFVLHKRAEVLGMITENYKTIAIA